MVKKRLIDKLVVKANLGLYQIGKSAYSKGKTLKNPVFIVGTGRCGTSLLVRIMDSHRDLIGFPNEANHLWHPKTYPFKNSKVETPPILIDPKQFTEESITSWQPGHENTIRNVIMGFYLLRGKSRKIFLKSAMISFMMPKILEIYPDARFIHIFRNGVSVVASLQKKEFTKHQLLVRSEKEFSEVCARYWNSTIEEIDRVNNELELKKKNLLFEISYEALCEDPREKMKQLTEFMGCDNEGFSFDFSTIRSRNYKAGDYKDEKWNDIITLMEPSMKLLGYI